MHLPENKTPLKMIKFVVLSVLVAVVAAEPAPGYLHAAPLAYSGHYSIPTAVSHQSRVDYYSKPLITTYAAPAVIAAPVVKSYGLWDGYGYGYGHGYGHGLHGW